MRPPRGTEDFSRRLPYTTDQPVGLRHVGEEEDPVDISFGAEYDAYQEQVRQFLVDKWGTDGPEERDEEMGYAPTPRFLKFAAAAIEAGYYCPFLPKKYGGAEQPFDPIKQVIIAREFRKFGVPTNPPGLGPNLLVPTLLEHGTEEQKETFIPRAMSGEDVWCQGYSEPNAGSDLASLRTRAVLDGVEWVINGQKIWTSMAEEATHMFCLCRTDPDAPKHKGISYILLDMKQPGVEVRPLRQLTGASEFNEVFLTDVRTPADWIVGEPGQGWAVANTTLLHERASVGAGILQGMHAGLVALARRTERGGRPAIEDPEVRRALARLDARSIAQELTEYRMVDQLGRGQDPGISIYLMKLMVTEIFHDQAKSYMDLAGDGAFEEAGYYSLTEAFETFRAWNTHHLGSLGFAIAAGTTNIQRKVIAERGLGLPREPKRVTT
jgi:alkylation response protein AidB-like acyl-CoA dehydrogenase